MTGYDFDKEHALADDCPLLVAGVDEAGRGPLAGPVVAAAVILPSLPQLEGLNDSKALTPKKRDALYSLIQEAAISLHVAVISPQIIDEINILQAALRAMRDAVRGLDQTPGRVLVDGNQKPGSGLPEMAIIKGDAKSASIMAASIIAKVTRDRLMIAYDEQYPEYGFAGHKGYGAKTHMEAIKKHGPCPIHRKTFEPIKTLLSSKLPLS